MGESDSARTERELAALRGRIETDIGLLRDRARADLDVREFVRRRPIPVFGGAAAAAALLVATVTRRMGAARQRRPAREIDDLIERLGGRIDKMRKKSRERLRESIRKEIGEVETGDKVQRAFWTTLAAGLTALATGLAQASARRFISEPPKEDEPRS